MPNNDKECKKTEMNILTVSSEDHQANRSWCIRKVWGDLQAGGFFTHNKVEAKLSECGVSAILQSDKQSKNTLFICLF